MKRYEDFGTGSPIESDHRITGEPKYKVIATAEFINMTPAHKRHVTKNGGGSSLRTAATDALDNVLKDDRVKRLRNKLPFKVVFQSGE